MCGRYTLATPLNDVAEAFGVAAGGLVPFRPAYKPRYNIAPTQPVIAVRQADDGDREFALLRWGLIPSWARDEKIGYSTINARAETVADKPAFRAAFKRRRCLIPADGYYEWQVTGGTKSKPTKQPYRIHYTDERPFGMAGLWERRGEGPDAVESCTIIVTSANAGLTKIHDRMPVIIEPADYGLWLDPEFQSREKLLSLLRPSPDEALTAYPVSTAVNNPRHDSPDCIDGE